MKVTHAIIDKMVEFNTGTGAAKSLYLGHKEFAELTTVFTDSLMSSEYPNIRFLSLQVYEVNLESHIGIGV